MSEERKRTTDVAEPQPDSSGPAAESGGADNTEPTLEQQLEELREKNLRLLAETRNFQQRAMREKQEALQYAEADFARELLVVLDDLERTLKSTQSADPAVAEGVRIVYDHFVKVLRGRNIARIVAEGEAFDPDQHEAVMQRPSADHPAGTVCEEVQPGYRMHDRVIRPTKVVVSSGPPEAGEG